MTAGERKSHDRATRRKAIYSDFVGGMDVKDICAKYDISSQRVYQIVKRERTEG